MKIVVVTHNLSLEGASISLKELVCALKERGKYHIDVISLFDGPLRKDYQASLINIHVIPKVSRRLFTTGQLQRTVEKIAAFLAESSPDLIFVNTLISYPAILAAEKIGVPAVWNVRESAPLSRCFGFLPRAVFDCAISAITLPKKIVFVAAASRAQWSAASNYNNFLVINNALDLRRFPSSGSPASPGFIDYAGGGEREINFLCVGTLCKRKGQLDALFALNSIVLKLKFPVRITFVGESRGVYALAVRLLAFRVGLKRHARIRFVRSTKNVSDHYRAADVFLMCSYEESYPRVVLEALAFGLPIISTRVFGISEQIPDSTDGCFYTPGDIDRLAGHLYHLADNVDARRQYAASSRRRFSELQNFDQMVDQYEAVIEESFNKS